MGMFDDVYCEADLPPGYSGSERAFQTKSLFNCLDQLTITREGRLVLHACRYESAPQAEGELPSMVRIPGGDVDLEFHGDVRLSALVDDKLVEYVARFTHGTLEWIRPWPELSDIHRSLLT
jgi:hypothetical protein